LGERMALKIALSFVCLVLLSQVISAQNTYTTYSNLSYVDDGNVAHKLLSVKKIFFKIFKICVLRLSEL
jgi:hypothetical protein